MSDKPVPWDSPVPERLYKTPLLPAEPPEAWIEAMVNALHECGLSADAAFMPDSAKHLYAALRRAIGARD